MRDYRVMRLRTGESFLAIVLEETGADITVLFPLLLNRQTYPVGENVMREVHSTTSFCPFTDEKHFTFLKSEFLFIKPMNDDAVPYYVDMLNKQEEPDILKIYDLEDLVKPDDFFEIAEDSDDRVAELISKMEGDEAEAEVEQVAGNKTLH